LLGLFYPSERDSHRSAEFYWSGTSDDLKGPAEIIQKCEFPEKKGFHVRQASPFGGKRSRARANFEYLTVALGTIQLLGERIAGLKFGA